MELETERKALGIPPLGKKDKRTPEQIVQAERATAASVSDYLAIREGHFERTIFEVLRASGLPFRTSAGLARTMRKLHTKEWMDKEDHGTTHALRNTTIPITPVEPRWPQVDIVPATAAGESIPFTPQKLAALEKEMRRIEKTGDFVSEAAFFGALERKIPTLRVAPKRSSL